MLSQYSNIDFIMHLDIDEGFEMLKKANEKQNDSILWDMWLVKYPWMDKDNFVSFNDFKNNILKKVEEPKKPTKTKQQIIADSEKIVAAWKKGGGCK
ncbi:hypothetical protein [Clostridium guangxiense]|uniref:hypothetical protein n=1 Tax=Clostridium guangxiense TaxID=1662055 RepID=UPI001E4A8231|nr:hypothetical protein [Clostridium guangxiense]MCD2345820.1 hypothetical protein [Clostridium guangxiense]